MKRTLITGFGPFGNVVDNPTQRLVEHFAIAGAPGHLLTTHVFPVSYAAVEKGLKSLLGASGAEDKNPYDIVLMLGVNSDAREWRIERLAANADTPGKTDMDGAVAGGSPIVPGMPVHLQSTLPVDRLVEALREAGIPAVISDSAGGYLCNHLMYRALAHLATGPLTISGFVHIPADPITLSTHSKSDSVDSPSFSTHVLAIETILKELA